MIKHLRGALLLAFLLCAGGALAANKAPSVSISAPKSGATFTAPASITITATASDPDGTIARVDFYQGTTLIGTRTAAPYSISWNNVAGGSYSLTAQATDNAGATKVSSAVAVTVTGPKLTIASPANGAIVYGGSVVVSGTFAGPAGSTVVIDNGNGTRIATVSGAEYYADVPIFVGANTLRVAVARRDKTADTASVTVTGNLNPLLVFTAPGATVVDDAQPVALAVDAMSPAGTISKVEFFRNGVLLATVPAPPFQFTWTNPPAGQQSITATATDSQGVQGSATLAITVNGPNAPPVVSMTAPANGASFTAPAFIALAASAIDGDGTIARVEFLQNGNVVGVTNVAPYAATLANVPPGSYALAARATDNRSGVATSSPVTITVAAPNTPPTVSLTSPLPGSHFAAPATIALAAAASDSDGIVARVDFYQGATLVGSKTSAPFTVSWSGVPSGSYALTAKAIDNLGAVATSAPVNVVVDANAPPAVTLTSPADHANYYAPATIALAANATDADGTIARVEFYQGTTLVGSAAAPPYTATWSGVPIGNYTLTAKAIDNAGGAAVSAPIAVTVFAGGFAIDTPAGSATLSADVVNVGGTVQAPANSGVTVNGIVAAVADGRFYANGIALVAGANTIAATLTTPDGTSTTRSVTVTSSGPAPVRISAAPTQGLAPLGVSVEVVAQPGIAIQKVEIDADGSGTIDGTLAAEPWSTTVNYLSPGTVNLAVKVTDTAGAVHTQVFPVVVADKAELDQTLRTVWGGMKTALAAGDKASALRFLDASARQKYGPVFDVLLPGMGQIVATFSDLQPVSLSDGLGEYAINRVIDGQNRIFFVYFGRNGDGVWRLGSM